MKIICGSCTAKYTVSDEKVQGKTVKVKCRKCGAVIVVSSTGEVQTTGGESSPGAAEESYTVSVSDTDQRTMTVSEIVTAYNEGTIDAETFIWAEGMDDWQALKDVDAVVDALHDAATAADLAEQEVAQPASPEDLERTMAMPEGGLDYNAAVAASDHAEPAPAGVEAFGGATVAIPDAAAAAEFAAGFAAPAAPAPAADAPFASGGSPNIAASATATPAAVRMPAGGDENSAIFSLNMLTAQAGSEDSGPGSSTTEDSGLIDLKALAAGMDGGGVAAAPAAPAGGMFPLGPPPVAPAMAAPVMARPAASGGGNKGLVYGLLAAVVVLGMALVFFMVKGGGDSANAGPATASPTEVAETPAATAAASTETTAPAATASAEASPAPTASASAASTGSVAVAARRKRPYPKTTGGGPKTPAKPKPTGKPKPKPKAKPGKCGCAPTDLMCHMRCKGK